MADALQEALPGDYPQECKAVVGIVGPENTKETGMFKEYYWVMPLAKLVEKYGLEHLDLSLDAIAEITKRNTGEYTIRPYLRQHTSATLKTMESWAQSPNVHLRRLASEGVRIRLPWAQKMGQFADDPSSILRIVELLKDDGSKFVQKSVANNLNDLLKDNYDAAVPVLERWAQQPTKARAWIVKHALRNQLKAGNDWAIALVESM